MAAPSVSVTKQSAAAVQAAQANSGILAIIAPCSGNGIPHEHADALFELWAWLGVPGCDSRGAATRTRNVLHGDRAQAHPRDQSVDQRPWLLLQPADLWRRDGPFGPRGYLRWSPGYDHGHGPRPWNRRRGEHLGCARRYRNQRAMGSHRRRQQHPGTPRCNRFWQLHGELGDHPRDGHRIQRDWHRGSASRRRRWHRRRVWIDRRQRDLWRHHRHGPDHASGVA